MDYKKRYLRLKAELITLKAELDIEYAKPITTLDINKIEQLNTLIDKYQKNLSKIEVELAKLCKNGQDLKMMVFLYHFCYGWSHSKIARKFSYSLPHIKRISAQISREIK